MAGKTTTWRPFCKLSATSSLTRWRVSRLAWQYCRPFSIEYYLYRKFMARKVEDLPFINQIRPQFPLSFATLRLMYVHAHVYPPCARVCVFDCSQKRLRRVERKQSWRRSFVNFGIGLPGTLENSGFRNNGQSSFPLLKNRALEDTVKNSSILG